MRLLAAARREHTVILAIHVVVGTEDFVDLVEDLIARVGPGGKSEIVA